MPGRQGVTLIINGQSGQWGTHYEDARDVARRPMTVDSLPATVERFTIRIDAGQLIMEWGSFRWSVSLIAP